MIELLGPMPRTFAMGGKNFDNFFEKVENKYCFKRMRPLIHIPLKKKLIDQYRLKIEEADKLSDFLNKILQWRNKDRISAQKLLDHEWLKMDANYNYKMSDLEYKKYQLRQHLETSDDQVPDVSLLIDSDYEDNKADQEDNLFSGSEESLSLSGETKTDNQQDEFSLNISFTGGYVPNTDLSRVDKGQNNP